ncbi:MAG: hypothetical protein QGG40_16690, partial [Myxococcota bacterium]|nr:hypothetical protein [Myxococcota bacterium]
SWQHTASPVLSGNTGKYRKDLTPAEISSVETVAGEVMDSLCYVRDSTEELRPGSLGVWLGEWALRLKVEWRSLRADSNHWKRWGRDLTVRLVRWKRWWLETPGEETPA